MMAFKIHAESKFKPKIADKSQLNCKHCNRDGHDETTCFQLHGYPDWWSDRPRGRRTAGRGNRGGGRSGSAAGRGNGRREQRAGASPARLNKTTAAASSLQQAGGINLAKSKDGLSDREEIVMADIDLKQQNSNNGLQGSESNDRISSLHDSILHHILSFLPTRDVVRTGILSKQWKSLWIGVSIFDISDCRCCSRACWNFVERVLLLRNRSSIKQFKLCFRSYATSSYPRVQSIISSLVSHKIPHLDISLYVNDQFTLPSSIFDCQSLRILNLKVLKGSRRKLTLEHISLPCLKVLHLHDFAFQNAESIEKLFSCCPVLEELNLERCGLIHRNSMTISIPSLKSLTMVDSFENFDLPKSSCYIKVEAPSLQSFNYTGLFTHHLYLTNVSSSSSIEACIRMIWNDYYVGIRAPRFVKLLQDLENMISLTISNQAVELLLLLEDTDSDRFPVFHHLESLHLNFKLTDHVFQGLLKFIYFFTPNLRTIKFSDVKFWMLQPLPNCFSSSLKFLELQNVDGHSSELFFLTCFLEKAALLQKINIYQSEYISVDKQQVLRDEVEKLSTRFKHCAINVW